MKIEILQKAFDYLKSKGFVHTRKEFAEKINTKPETVSRAFKGDEKYLTKNLFLKMNHAFENIFNESWLLHGQEPMLNAESKTKSIVCNGSKQPILDIRVCAGHGIGLCGNDNKIIEWVNIPKFEGCFGVTIYGDSMYNKYISGDIIFIREIKSVSEIENGQPYVIVTKEDRFIRLLYIENGGITLVAYNNSFNPDGRRKYPDKNILEDDILFLYKVVGRLEQTQL